MSKRPITPEAFAYLGQLARELKTQEEIGATTNEAFRWARQDSRRFNPAAQSGNSQILESDDLMHRRVRNEDLNNSQIKKIVTALTDLIVGKGVQTYANPFDAEMSLADINSGLQAELSYMFESDDLFEEWAIGEDRQCDYQRRQTWPEMQRQAIAECVRVGDSFLLRCADNKLLRNGQKRIVPLCYQILERDQLSSENDMDGDGIKRIVRGIETDENNVVVAYHFYDRHPHDHDGSGINRTTRIPAQRLTHLCLFRRPSDSLGYSWLHAIGQDSFDRDRFIGNEIQTAAKAALLLLVAKLKNQKIGGMGLGLEDGAAGTDEHGNAVVKLGNTPVAMKIGADDDIKVVETNRPNSQADSFIGILDHGIAGGANLSYYTLTGRMDQTSFSSLRGAMIQEDNSMQPLQQWFSNRLVLPVRGEFHRQAIAYDRYRNLDVTAYVDNPRKYSRFEAIAPGRDFLDPEAEINASLARLRSGQSTLQLECARRGLHWIRILIQKARENALSAHLGVLLDYSKGQGGQVTKTTSDSQGATNA
jgi:lambda family phage portal protein